MKAVNLMTEYLKNPIGIDLQKPYLIWNCEGGKTQTAYRIVASSAKITVWDSGKVQSGRMRAEYPNELMSRQRVEWRVQLWDENDEAGDWSEPAFFEMGLLSANDWKAKWISGNYHVNKKKRYPVDCFQKAFTAIGVQKAKLYITACGLYEIKLNGKRVGDFVLAPGHTDYRKRIQYQTYDVTELIQGGANVLTAELADGWYRGSCGAWGLKNQYGTQTKLLAQLELFDTDGKVTRICTDESWSWSNDGAIRFADNKDGEIVDARKKPSYGGRAKVAKCSVVPSASNNVHITEHESFTHPKVIKTSSGKTVLDFGQNIAGYIAFTVNAGAGREIKLRFGEMLDSDGELTLKNIQCATKKRQTPLQQIIYTCKEGVNVYKTKFAVFGFQYAEVTGCDINNAEFKAIAVYSDMEETLRFECSHRLINQLVANTRWSAKNNHADVPTDCPTRERHGWTGDAQIFANTAGYLFNYAAFARKYTVDMRDGQRRNGNFRQITPPGGIDQYMNVMDGSPGWSDAGVLIPYRMYKRYGDERILRENYDAMRKYALRKIKTLGKWYLTSLPTGVGWKYRKYISNYGQSYGEWSEPVDVNSFRISDFVSPHPEETTAYIVYMLEHMQKIARILGKTQDISIYKKYADKARIGYQKLVETKKYSYDTDRQAKLVRPLYMKLLDKQQTDFAKKRLIKALDSYGWRLGTGFLATPFILYVLADMNIGYAYRLLENEECPGWLYMPKMGATTIWESWEGFDSRDHYSKGAVCEWLFDTMCGIRIAGENKFCIVPTPGGSLTYAECEYSSIYGKVASRWEKVGDTVKYTITIPANTTAQIVLPSGTRTVGAGTYEL
mgnify:CR=1 FL=1